MGRYLIDSWGRKCHEYHSDRLTINCNSCYRLLDPKESIAYPDGRKICKECDQMAVNDPVKAKIARDSIFSMFNRAKLHLPQNKISLTISDLLFFRQNLGIANENVVGITRIKTRNYCRSNMQLRKNYEVYILSGIPIPVFYGILAHEFMHIYLSENDFKLSLIEEEGICELINYYMLQTFQNSKLATIHSDKLLNNCDPIYGAGFRMIRKRWAKHSEINHFLQNQIDNRKL